MEHGERHLTEADRRLLASLVQKRAGSAAAAIGGAEAPVTNVASQARWLDFNTLSGFAEQRLLRSAGAALGLRDPYFLLHEGNAGARTTIDGRPTVNFSSYDYLGLNRHPAVRAAAQAAIDRYGVSASASRLVAGERPIHRALEAALTRHYEQDACLTFVSGHATNVSTISALLGPRDLVVHDALAHNSIIVGAQLSRAERRSFPHNDLSTLDSMLESIRNRYERVLIVAEGLYSMDGDVCDLPGLVALKERRHAWLMIDDAHGLGTLGPRGQGVFEHFGLDPRRVDIWMGTLSKTLAACGGYIAGPAPLIDYLKHSAGGFVYSVGMSPPLAAAALAALEAAPCGAGESAAPAAKRARLRIRLPAGWTGHRREHWRSDLACDDRRLDPRRRSQPAAVSSQRQRPADHRPGGSRAACAAEVFFSSEHTTEDILACVQSIAEELAALGEARGLTPA